MTHPPTVASGMRSLADWIDQADRIIDDCFAAEGMERRHRGDEVQQDLRKMAAWLEAHPAVDAELAAATWAGAEGWR